MVRFLLPSFSSNSPYFNHFYTPIPNMPCKSVCYQNPYGQKSCFKVCKMWPEHILPHPVLPPPLPPPPRPRPFSPLHRDTLPGKTLLLLSIAITASTIFGFFMVCILFKRVLRYYYSRDLMRRNRATLFDLRQNSPDDDDGGEGPVMDNHFWYVNTIGFQQSVIDSITMFQYKKDERLIDGTECSVCLGDFEENESLRLLPKCNHAFHVPCIDTWLRSHKNCPICRAPIMSNIAESHESIPHVETQMEIPEEGNSISSRNNQVDEEGISGVRRVSEIPMKEFPRTSSDLSENRHGQDGEVKQTMRRSVSLDSVSASVIHKEMKNIETPNEASSSSGNGKAKNIEKQGMGNQRIINLVKSTSIGLCSMKRINSSGKKLFSYSHSRSQSSVLPL